MYNTFIFYAPFSKNMQGVEMLCCYYVLKLTYLVGSKKICTSEWIKDVRHFVSVVPVGHYAFSFTQSINTR